MKNIQNDLDNMINKMIDGHLIKNTNYEERKNIVDELKEQHNMLFKNDQWSDIENKYYDKYINGEIELIDAQKEIATHINK